MVDVSINDTGYKIIPDLKKYVADSGYLKEIALQAVWSVSTRKPGYIYPYLLIDNVFK